MSVSGSPKKGRKLSDMVPHLEDHMNPTNWGHMPYPMKSLRDLFEGHLVLKVESHCYTTQAMRLNASCSLMTWDEGIMACLVPRYRPRPSKQLRPRYLFVDALVQAAHGRRRWFKGSRRETASPMLEPEHDPAKQESPSHELHQGSTYRNTFHRQKCLS